MWQDQAMMHSEKPYAHKLNGHYTLVQTRGVPRREVRGGETPA
jgi:hypothetical protein